MIKNWNVMRYDRKFGLWERREGVYLKLQRYNPSRFLVNPAKMRVLDVRYVQDLVVPTTSQFSIRLQQFHFLRDTWNMVNEYTMVALRNEQYSRTRFNTVKHENGIDYAIICVLVVFLIFVGQVNNEIYVCKRTVIWDILIHLSVICSMGEEGGCLSELQEHRRNRVLILTCLKYIRRAHVGRWLTARFEWSDDGWSHRDSFPTVIVTIPPAESVEHNARAYEGGIPKITVIAHKVFFLENGTHSIAICMKIWILSFIVPVR